jgi:NAD(P)H-quinone oxidoreductase subunit 5
VQIYRLALERGHLDTWLAEGLVAPVIQLFEYCDSLERRWTNFIARGPSRESEQTRSPAASLEELL